VAESIRGFQEILEGKHDEMPESAFFMKGSIDEVRGTSETSETSDSSSASEEEAEAEDQAAAESGAESETSTGDE